MKTQVVVLLLIAAFLSRDVNAQIRIPCATNESLTTRTCCPVPDPNTFEDAGPCGVNLGRGSCDPIAIPDSEFDANQKDVRMKGPIQYFNRTCVCEGRLTSADTTVESAATHTTTEPQNARRRPFIPAYQSVI